MFISSDDRFQTFGFSCLICRDSYTEPVVSGCLAVFRVACVTQFLYSTLPVSHSPCIPHCLCHTVPIFHTACATKSVYSTLPVSHSPCIPHCPCHTVCIPHCPCHTVPVFHTARVTQSLYSILPVSHSPCIPHCLCACMRVLTAIQRLKPRVPA